MISIPIEKTRIPMEIWPRELHVTVPKEQCSFSPLIVRRIRPSAYIPGRIIKESVGFSCPRCGLVLPMLDHFQFLTCECNLTMQRFGNSLDFWDDDSGTNLTVAVTATPQMRPAKTPIALPPRAPDDKQQMPGPDLSGHGHDANNVRGIWNRWRKRR